ncbi:alpha/beta hydrolase [Halobacterium salinarum]|uniref:alpha/beta hydrolase n=1 Tax=Halobacterium salinarum TaxID=2242 RepID=UPI002286764E|nr:alpha/beta hydrolase [Halobacterium salinarum]MCF2240818.1 alpha/beta hydrolase [Halobacterium salinarum]
MPHRRQFLTTAATALSGASVFGVAPATAASVPCVSTRDHFDENGTLTPENTARSYDTTSDVPVVDTDCVSDLTVFVHGWNKSGSDPEQRALDKITTADTELTENGYDGAVVGYTWDSDKGDGLDFGWDVAQGIAQRNGRKLAQFALDVKRSCPETTLRFVSHSLGAQVAFSALRTLNDRSAWDSLDTTIQTVHPLGAATDNDVPTKETGRATYDAIKAQTGSVYNYHNAADDVLQWAYGTIEFDDALGETGVESDDTPPANYTDRDVESQVGDDHSNYLNTVADDVLGDM